MHSIHRYFEPPFNPIHWKKVLGRLQDPISGYGELLLLQQDFPAEWRQIRRCIPEYYAEHLGDFGNDDQSTLVARAMSAWLDAMNTSPG